MPIRTCSGRTLDVNNRQPLRIVRTLLEELGGSIAGRSDRRLGPRVQGRHRRRARFVGRCGSSKNSWSEAPTVVAYDPAIDGSGIDLPCRFAGSALEAAEADALLVLTEWPEFRYVDPWALAHRLREKVVVDGRNVLDIDALSAAGLRYRGVGRRRNTEPVVLAEVG